MFERLETNENRLKEICLISGSGLTSNVYTIDLDNITLVDTGNGAKENLLVHDLQKLGMRASEVAQVIITHPHSDHLGGFFQLVHDTSPQLLIYNDDASLIREYGWEKIRELRDRDTILTKQRRFTVIHTPGHTSGSICLYDEDNKILFSGDTVFPNGLFGRFDLESGSVNAIIESLRRLSSMDIDILLPGHYRPIFHNANEHIKRSLNAASQLI